MNQVCNSAQSIENKQPALYINPSHRNFDRLKNTPKNACYLRIGFMRLIGFTHSCIFKRIIEWRGVFQILSCIKPILSFCSERIKTVFKRSRYPHCTVHESLSGWGTGSRTDSWGPLKPWALMWDGITRPHRNRPHHWSSKRPVAPPPHVPAVSSHDLCAVVSLMPAGCCALF